MRDAQAEEDDYSFLNVAAFKMDEGPTARLQTHLAKLQSPVHAAEVASAAAAAAAAAAANKTKLRSQRRSDAAVAAEQNPAAATAELNPAEPALDSLNSWPGVPGLLSPVGSADIDVC